MPFADPVVGEHFDPAACEHVRDTIEKKVDAHRRSGNKQRPKRGRDAGIASCRFRCVKPGSEMRRPVGCIAETLRLSLVPGGSEDGAPRDDIVCADVVDQRVERRERFIRPPDALCLTAEKRIYESGSSDGRALSPPIVDKGDIRMTRERERRAAPCQSAPDDDDLVRFEELVQFDGTLKFLCRGIIL